MPLAAIKLLHQRSFPWLNNSSFNGLVIIVFGLWPFAGYNYSVSDVTNVTMRWWTDMTCFVCLSDKSWQTLKNEGNIIFPIATATRRQDISWHDMLQYKTSCCCYKHFLWPRNWFAWNESQRNLETCQYSESAPHEDYWLNNGDWLQLPIVGENRGDRGREAAGL